MYAQQYGYRPELNGGITLAPYIGMVSTYDNCNAIPFPYTCCNCDTNYEMVWCGSQNGFVRGFGIDNLDLRCSVEVIENKCIYGIQSTPMYDKLLTCYLSGVLTVTEAGMNIYNYGGVLKGKMGYELPEAGMYRCGCGYFNSSTSLLSLAGEFGGVYTFDLISGKKKRRNFQDKCCSISMYENGCVMGTTNGGVVVMDSRMNKCVYSLPAFMCTTQKVIKTDDFLIVLGIDHPPKGGSLPISSVKVFDARNYEIKAYTHLFMPNINSICEMNEKTNTFLASDLVGNCCVYNITQNNVAGVMEFGFPNDESEIITSSTVSSTKNIIVGVSIMGGIHVLGRSASATVNLHSKLYPTPSMRPSLPFTIEYRGAGGLASVDLMHLSDEERDRQNLLRSSNPDMFENVIVGLPKTRGVIDPRLIESSTKSSENIKHVIRLSQKIIPNSILYGSSDSYASSILVNVDPRNQHDASWEAEEESAVDISIPSELRYKEMKLNHHGFYDLNYEDFNTTCFLGLENCIPNSFLNTVLYFLWSIPAFHYNVLLHTCSEPLCVTCQCRFLFRMFDQGRKDVNHTTTIHATNLYRMLVHRADAISFGIFDNSASVPVLRTKRFISYMISRIMSELEADYSTKKALSSSITSRNMNLQNLFSLFGISYTTNSYCCEGHYSSKNGFQYIIELNWSIKSDSFVGVLEKSLCFKSEGMSQWCDQCKREKSCKQEKSITSLSDYLIIMVNSDNKDEIMQNWLTRPSYFSTSFSIRQSASSLSIEETSASSGLQYQLFGVLSIINEKKHPHTIYETNLDGQWYFFNDYSIGETTIEKATQFSSWKTPICLLYKNVDTVEDMDFSKDILPTTTLPFYSQGSLGMVNLPYSFHQLSNESLPKKGDLISIDCEFIALDCEQAEITPDGHRIIRKEANLSLGRVSCLTKDLDMFIDDYILTGDPVADYLTRFSGLTHDDLEAKISSHYLVTLKDAYSRLRTLVDRGCIFVGHGLSKDFRIINIFVPPEQIIDTVTIYYLPHHRCLSLKYLAKVVLGNTIQEGNHDSHEDAQATLELYYKYKELVNEGKWEETLNYVYEVGKQCNFYGTSPPPLVYK